MSNIVDTVEDRIQNALLTAIDNIVAPNIELAIRSINASSGRDVTSASVNSELREHVGINTSFENASENNNVLHVSNVNDETRRDFPDEVSELSVPGTRFDHKYHKTTIYQWLNKHQEIKTQTRTIPSIVWLTQLQELQPNNDHKQPQCSNQYPQIL